MAKKSKKVPGVNLYANLAQKRRTTKESASRKKAVYLASLPKHPLKRVLYRLHPKRFFGYWFSRQGAIMALKVFGVGVLLVVVLAGALFAYYRKDLDAIRPQELNKRVQTTVTKYYDRNGQLLWEDKGEGDYTLVVDGKIIPKYMKQATIAIEDKDFYKHGGVSFTGTLRAALSNSRGNSTQGGSTLTQQLVKQVFFSDDDASNRGLSGIPRKIKEMILAIEVERMYSKEDILNLYLNESPYGGRRNGVESAAQTYFGKSSKDLTLAESALLASIPNQPGLYDPYNAGGHEALKARQHKVLDNMVTEGFITNTQAEEAKKVAIFDTIKDPTDQLANIKAPHFVLFVRSQLEKELGKATLGRGGLTIKTTLDYRIQTKLEESMTEMFASSTPAFAGFSNGAGVVEDTQSGQVIAMLGSRDFTYPGYGQDNAATAFIQPGSTIKPLVYAQLFQDHGAGKQNYGSGSVLADDQSMTKIYGAPLRNADGKYRGNIPLRVALPLSRNVPAVKAMYVNGIQESWDTIRALGDTQYCTQGVEAQAGLSSAIGGCGTRMIDHVNAFASLGRLGVYKPTSSVLEVKNSQGEIIKKFKEESKQVVDPQAAYIVNDILSDPVARAGLWSFSVPGLSKIAVKTGTSDKGGQAKDIWTCAYTPALSMSVWLGNSDTSILRNGNSTIPARIVKDVLAYAHSDIYANEGKWKASDWWTEPAGIQKIGKEIYPSYYNKATAASNSQMTFDKVSKKKATSCTPQAAKETLNVMTVKDPISKKDVTTAPDGYITTEEDDVHSCDDARPGVAFGSAGNGVVTVSISQGKFPLSSITVNVGGQDYTQQLNSAGSAKVQYSGTPPKGTSVTVTITDEGYYQATASGKIDGSSAYQSPSGGTLFASTNRGRRQ